jgi:hypothetical protein
MVLTISDELVYSFDLKPNKVYVLNGYVVITDNDHDLVTGIIFVLLKAHINNDKLYYNFTNTESILDKRLSDCTIKVTACDNHLYIYGSNSPSLYTLWEPCIKVTAHDITK